MVLITCTRCAAETTEQYKTFRWNLFDIFHSAPNCRLQWPGMHLRLDGNSALKTSTPSI
jgi:hypothetical protein